MTYYVWSKCPTWSRWGVEKAYSSYKAASDEFHRRRMKYPACEHQVRT